MATRKQRKRVAVQGGATALFVFLAVSSGGWLWWTAAACTGAATGWTLYSSRRRRPKRRAPLPPKPRKPAQRKPVRMTAKTMPERARPVGPRAPKVRGRAHVCSAACRMSKKPASTCDCSCRGTSHGIWANKRVPR